MDVLLVNIEMQTQFFGTRKQAIYLFRKLQQIRCGGD